MKLPSMTLGPHTGGRYAAHGAATPARAGVAPQLDIGCLLGCGVGALGCIYCGVNPVCWAACAGPQAIGCISKCL